MKELKVLSPKQINRWTCHKLECFSDYLETYTKTLGNSGCCYLELFAGRGSCSCRGTNCVIDDSALRALKTKFSQCIFAVKDYQDAENLKQIARPFGTENTIITGSLISEKVMRQAFDLIPRSSCSFALVNPSGYRMLRWSTIRKLAVHGHDWRGHRMDMLIIMPLEMALLRNLARPECEASINRLFGNQKWQQVRQKRRGCKIEPDKARKELVGLFMAGLKSLGYKHVEDFKPAHFTNLPYYHLIWASDRASRAKELADAWGNPRYLPCELLYNAKGENLDE